MVFPKYTDPVLLRVLTVIAALAIALPCARADEAKALYDQARNAFHDGKYIEAADLFRAAYEKRPAWKILYNIGQSEAAAARYGLALEAFELYLVKGADDVGDDRRDEVLKEVERLRLLVGFLKIEGEDGLTLTVDGVVRGETPFAGPIRVAAGAHAVALKKGEDVLVNESFTIAGGVTSTVSTVSEQPVIQENEETASTESPPPETEPAATPPVKDTSKWRLISGIAALGVGAASLVVGSVFAYKGSQDYQKAKDYQGVDRTKFDEYNDEKVPRDRVLTITGFAVGGVFAIAGATFFVLHRKKQKETQSAQALQLDSSGLSVRF